MTGASPADSTQAAYDPRDDAAAATPATSTPMADQQRKEGR